MIRIIHISDLHYQTNYNKLNCFYKELMPQLLSPFVIIDELLKAYDKNGNVITNSKKNKIMQYINSLPLSAIQKIYLFHTAGYSVKSYRNQLYNYVNSLDISASEKQRIWTDLGF